MAKMKPEDLAHIYNNMARVRKLPLIPKTAKMTLDEVADKIEWANTIPIPKPRNKMNGFERKLSDKEKRRQLERDRRAATGRWIKNFLFPPKPVAVKIKSRNGC